MNYPRLFRLNIWLAALIVAPFFGQSQSLNPPREWAVAYGGSNFDFITDAVLDPAGNLYVTGYSNSANLPVTFTTYSGVSYDAFVAKFDSLGTLVWAGKYGGSGDEFGNAIALDKDGNLLVTGRTTAAAPFYSHTSMQGTGEDILVLKLTPSGAVIQAHKYGGSGSDNGLGISSGPAGEILITGSSLSSDLPVTSGTYSGAGRDAFLLRLHEDGSRHWAMRYGGLSFERAYDVEVGADGSVFVCGETGSFDFPQTIASWQGTGSTKSFVARFDSTGNRNWALRYGGANVERAYGLTLHGGNQVLVTGYTSSGDFPETFSSPSGNGLDAMLISFDLSGNRIFATSFGGNLDDLGVDLVTDAAGNIFMKGETQSSDFPSTNAGFAGSSRDMFLAKFGPSGGLNWALPYGGSINDFAGGVQVSGNSGIYLAGHTQSSDFPLTNPGSGGNTARGAVIKFRDCLGQMAGFTFSNGCDSDTILFTNTSFVGSNDTLAYRWWFGDGDSTDVFSPSHVYAAPGPYDVTLRITSPCGVDSFLTQRVEIYPNPVAAFGNSLPCAVDWLYFSDSTAQDTLLGSSLVAWSWDFGNGDSSALQDPVYGYPIPGNYTLNLQVTNNHGCADLLSSPITVYPKPVAHFGVADHCYGDSVALLDSSSVASGLLNGWNWNLGNGDSSSVQSFSYLYTAADTYAVQLVIQSDQGCRDTAWQEVQVLPRPVPNFGADEVCFPSPVTFTDSTTISGDVIASLLWNFDDGNTDTTSNPVHPYQAAGTFDVVLWAYAASGCADSISIPVKLNDKPIADFAFLNVCWPDTTFFTDSSSVLDDSLVVWSWDLGDGNFSSIPNPTHAYAVADTYLVSLQLESGFGCRDTVSRPVISLPKPQADFAAPDVCYPLAAQFSDSSAVIGDALGGFAWDFGDGNSSSAINPAHNYATAGSYLVSLLVTTVSGCQDTLTDSLEVYPQPNADFEVENACDGTPVDISDASSVSSGTVDFHWYEMGDGMGSSTQADTSYVYGQAGTWLITHVVESNLGCLDSVVKSVVVYELPQPDIQYTGRQDICQGDTMQLFELQSFVSYFWDNGDTTDAIMLHGISGWMNLVVSDTNGCVNEDSLEIRFHNVPRPNAVILPGNEVEWCDNDSLFLDVGGSYATYLWSDSAVTRSRYVPAAGSYSVIVENGFGCADTSETSEVTFLTAPGVPVITDTGGILSVDTAYAWQWYLNGLAIPGATGQQWTPAATGYYQVEVFNSAGCSAISDTLDQLVGAQELFLPGFRVFPNPFQESVQLNWELEKGGEVRVSLYSADGKRVHHQVLRYSAGDFQLEIETSGLSSGIYLLEVQTARGERAVMRIVKRD